MFWFGFILGAIVGANTGLVAFALLNALRSDEGYNAVAVEPVLHR